MIKIKVDEFCVLIMSDLAELVPFYDIYVAMSQLTLCVWHVRIYQKR